MSGINLKKDYHKGFELIKAAAEQGYGLAMRDLGRCYQFANGTPGNMKTAIEWYEKALEVIDDPELEQKVMMFKMMGDMDEGFGEDYPEEDEDFDPSEIDGILGAIFGAIAALDKYECELAEEGLLPGEPTDDGQFQRVHLKAEEGDEKAIALLKQLDDMDDEDEEDDEDEDDEEMDKYMTGIAPDAVTNAWKYEDELDEAGVLPDEPHGDAAWGELPRVHKKAEEGDAKAIKILKELDELNG